MSITTKIGGRKFAVLLLSIVIYTVSLGYILLNDIPDKAGIIVAIATGLTMIVGSYIAGNVLQKNKGLNE